MPTRQAGAAVEMTNAAEAFGSPRARRRVPRALAAVALLACLLLAAGAACGSGGTGGGAAPSSAASVSPGSAAGASPGSASRTAITVGLFPWVPRPAQVETAIRAAWRLRHPNVGLEFVFWDCYASDPPDTLDVFVFDAVFLEHFRERGLLQPLPRSLLGDSHDVLPVAAEAASEDGSLWGIPQYLCTDVLIYRRGDRELERARDLSDVVEAIGTRTYSGRRPPGNIGLLVDLSDVTAVGCLYIDALQDDDGRYAADPPLPWHAGELDAAVLDSVADLRRMASLSDARYVSDEGFQRERWFGEGYGRAAISYTESLAAMSPRGRARATVKLLPLSESEDVPLLFVDLIGVNSALSSRNPDQGALAEELAGLMGATGVMLDALGPWRDSDSPQYLLPARHTVFRDLARQYPLYAELYGLVTAAEPCPFLFGVESRRWFRTMGPVIQRRVLAAR